MDIFGYIMKYSITPNNISTVNFETAFGSFVEIGSPEFYERPGDQHYRLLSYFSTLFNNVNILDIGSHRGYSALALSYNRSNRIHSFDIVDNIVPSIKTVDSIKFYNADLFNHAVFNSYVPLILSCPFIFLDVDPHNGKMEIELYRFLKEIDYAGFVICDDIWYFKEMRDHFWYQVPDSERYDLTAVGHWSGTGIVSFSPEIAFDKRDNSNWTLVTAYFNLTKCPDASREIAARDANYYFEHAVSTLSLPYNLVIYCDEESLPKIRSVRPAYLADKTRYVVRQFDALAFDQFLISDSGNTNTKTFADHRQTIIANREKHPYNFDNRNTASYYLFCLSRYMMLKETITENTFGSTHFAWINFCIERMGYKNVVHLDEGLSVKRDKFSTCYIDYIPESLVQNTHEYYRWGRCSMCSGFFTGSAHYMYRVCDLIEKKFLTYLDQGYGHADEQLYSPVYFENPELFEHYYGDYQQMVANYRYIYDAPEPPIYNFITRSFEHGNYAKCLEACEFVLRSHFLGKCRINREWMDRLYQKYNQCRDILKV